MKKLASNEATDWEDPLSLANDGDGKLIDSEPVTAHPSDDDHHTSSDLESLRQQLKTLTSSLAVVSQQKSKIEAIYVAEKKKLKVSNSYLSEMAVIRL